MRHDVHAQARVLARRRRAVDRVLARRLLRRGDFTSREELEAESHRKQAQIEEEAAVNKYSSSVLPSPPANSTRPAWSLPTRPQVRGSAAGGISRPMTWICGPSSAGSRTRQSPRADLHARLLPHLDLRRTLAPVTYTERTGRTGTPSPPPGALRPPARPPAADPAGQPYRTSAPCWTTWPP